MQKKVIIVGGGACALMLGCELDPKKFDVCIYEKNAAPARKFLVAGDGGLNVTHSENEDKFIDRYTPRDFLEAAFRHFSNRDLMHWLQGLGVSTYVGSSGRVFPEKGIKPIEVLTAMLEKIKSNGVSWKLKREWNGFSKENELIFTQQGNTQHVKPDLVIFCLGGASWPVTGSTGSWTHFFSEKNIRIHPFLASNCAFGVHWDQELLSKIEGKALKNISITCGSHTHAGEVVITRFGIEGSGIYPLSPQIREELSAQQKAIVSIDLKPSVTTEQLMQKLKTKRVKLNFTAHVKKELHLTDVQVALLKQLLTKEDFLDVDKLCYHIKHLKISIHSLGPIEDAISTTGGIALDEIDKNFQLKKIPACFAIGEMLDYDAPTGGYLLQSCFSMGKFLADHLNAMSRIGF